MAKKINKKRLLIYSLVFSPDGVSTAYLYNDIALGFLENGYEVTVLTTTPHYNLIQESIDRQPLKKQLFGLFFVSNFRYDDLVEELLHVLDGGTVDLQETLGLACLTRL